MTTNSKIPATPASTAFSCKKPIAMRRANVSTVPEWQLYDGSITISWSAEKEVFKVFLDDFLIHKNTKKVYIGLIKEHDTPTLNTWFFHCFPLASKRQYFLKKDAVDAAISYLEDIMSCKVAKIKTDGQTYWRIYYKSTIPTVAGGITK